MSSAKQGETTMAAIIESLTADVPVDFAAKEWDRFMADAFRQGYTLRDDAPERLDADACEVMFASIGEQAPAVSVTVSCDVPEDKEAVRETLRRDMAEYRSYLLNDCDRVRCRTH
jgi:hypothetical protein